MVEAPGCGQFLFCKAPADNAAVLPEPYFTVNLRSGNIIRREHLTVSDNAVQIPVPEDMLIEIEGVVQRCSFGLTAKRTGAVHLIAAECPFSEAVLQRVTAIFTAAGALLWIFAAGCCPAVTERL